MAHGQTRDAVLGRLLNSDEPSIRWKARVKILGEKRDSSAIEALEAEIQTSARVRSLLQTTARGNGAGVNIYAKWQGSQWVLMTLADIGYPRGDQSLKPAADEMISTWLEDRFFNEFEATSKEEVYAKLKTGIPIMDGRYRTCASQQGNALHSVIALGLEDERIHQLAERLLFWQWPDGGWNCDKNPDADSSTFIHTLWSMRGLEPMPTGPTVPKRGPRWNEPPKYSSNAGCSREPPTAGSSATHSSNSTIRSTGTTTSSER